MCNSPGLQLTDDMLENVKTGKATLKLGLDLQEWAGRRAVYTGPTGDKLHVVVSYSLCEFIKYLSTEDK